MTRTAKAFEAFRNKAETTERAYHRYVALLRELRERAGRLPDFEFETPVAHLDGLAASTGYSLTTLRRLADVRDSEIREKVYAAEREAS